MIKNNKIIRIENDDNGVHYVYDLYSIPKSEWDGKKIDDPLFERLADEFLIGEFIGFQNLHLNVYANDILQQNLKYETENSKKIIRFHEKERNHFLISVNKAIGAQANVYDFEVKNFEPKKLKLLTKSLTIEGHYDFGFPTLAYAIEYDRIKYDLEESDGGRNASFFVANDGGKFVKVES